MIFPPETGQGFRDYLDLNVEAEEFGFHASFLVEHHFTLRKQILSMPTPEDIVARLDELAMA